MAAGSGVTGTVRELYELKVEVMDSAGLMGFQLSTDSGRFIRITARGNGFLRFMVRNITGTLVEAGRGNMDAAGVVSALKSCDRKNAGPTAPASGLFLERVQY